ncbi:thioredoxin family protein [Schinkia azotoformans]|uniref:thioredoxin family protein n=1 Tax=Schinkia azotoformans TaxID=1454 RepID=UPI002DBA827A|nr:thioredoxin family protein [Schinkia azotoformans]MEC1718939.1 thioredoxin family protein [Schinkia azotoformans]MED4412031.1 thioredoxin family protein [Schinkia azotoformans]
MNIKVLGTGCKKCKALEANVNEAINELGIQAQIEKVEDIPTIMKYGVMSTPALVVNEKVVSTGKLLSSAEIKSHLS